MKQIDPNLATKKYNPRNIVFVLSTDKVGKPNGMIASFHTKCSDEPLLFAVAIYKKQNTHKLIRESKEFVLAVPNNKLLSAINIFGEMHGDKTDKFKLSKVKTFKIKNYQTPLFKDATINFACKLVKSIPTGDHTLFIGEVTDAFLDEKQKILLSFGRNTKGKRIFKEF
jgi:flavin reductase (DIM6/NTAB) family NADH-FMN oxidoreductase RutF